jgi:hypothetical protein
MVTLKILKRYNEYCDNHNLLKKKEIQDEDIKKLVVEIKNTIKKLETVYDQDPQLRAKFLMFRMERKLLKEKHKIWVNSSISNLQHIIANTHIWTKRN